MIRKLKSILKVFGQEIQVYQLVLKHPKTPKLAKWLIGMAIAYFLSPIDLIPDFIPILGQLDDLLIVPLLITIAVRIIPREVLNEIRLKAR